MNGEVPFLAEEFKDYLYVKEKKAAAKSYNNYIQNLDKEFLTNTKYCGELARLESIIDEEGLDKALALLKDILNTLKEEKRKARSDAQIEKEEKIRGLRNLNKWHSALKKYIEFLKWYDDPIQTIRILYKVLKH